VLEGADVFILSHETSIGDTPIDATVLLAKAIAEAENIYDHEKAYQDMRNLSMIEGKKATVTDMLCTTATAIALDNNVDLFICLTSTGKVARFLAKQRPMQTILACSTTSSVVRQVNTSRGVIGYKVPGHLKGHSERLISLVLKVAKE
jgi:pyruvate kinase